MSKRVTIKASVYRGKHGFTVNYGRELDVFCTSREQAEAYKALIRAELPFAEHCARSYEILKG
jgi:hypothetical protein